MASDTATAIPQALIPLLQRSTEDNRPVVLMTCGIAGSGKTTLAKAVIEKFPQFTRLSIDEIIFEKHGMYGIDYAADRDLHEQFQDEANVIYLETFLSLLRDKKDIVLEKSFWEKRHRDEYKKMVENGGGRWVLVYFKATDKEALWKRICERSAKERNANSAFDISREVYDRYWSGWEEPSNEGEIVVDIFSPKHASDVSPITAS